MEVFLLIFSICFVFILFSFKASTAADTLAFDETLRDNDTLVSANGIFELGFFSPSASTNRYLGIWFRNVPEQTVVWVANRNCPLNDSSGELTIIPNGNIAIFSNRSKNAMIWSSNSSATTSGNAILKLLSTGNLVIKDIGNTNDNPDECLWQSFDYPFDSLLPGMKLGWNLRTGHNWFLTSWKSFQDPSVGDYTYKLDIRGLPQLYIRKRNDIVYRSGPWDGLRFGGGPRLASSSPFKPILVRNKNYLYFTFKNHDQSTRTRFILHPMGSCLILTWSQNRNDWIELFNTYSDRCAKYSRCGPNGICFENKAPLCQCPTGFVPKVLEHWDKFDWSDGCVQRTPLNCSKDEGFQRLSTMKLPDNSYILTDETLGDDVSCEDACRRNCSCVAYAKTEFSDCVVWYDDLLDMREYSEGGQDLYIRMAASELELEAKESQRTKIILFVLIVSTALVLVSVSSYIIWKCKPNERIGQSFGNSHQGENPWLEEKDLELPLFNLSIVAAATNNFSVSNKIGEGGFGPVFKGKLLTGQEIAVKKLSEDSGQGIQELKNEIILIAKLQHRNLVKLLGCCIHSEERMLVYEYMPNRSLDLHIFNQLKGTSLDWQKRFDIIVGVARGLLYLHRDSRLRIVHRDLKASNILLDRDMNPKISDFGLARMFGYDQTEAKTRRVMGTFGYMSPEYAIDGQFSVKSDVFSFGVLVLEILSGRSNREFFHPDHELNLLGHAWKLWNEERATELLDPLIEKPINTSEVLRCIQVGLLCVQQRPGDRPSMSSVVVMLICENFFLPQPRKPGYYTDRCLWSDTGTCNTSNEITVTKLIGR